MREVLFDCAGKEREAILAVLGETLAARPVVVFAYAYGSFLEERPFHDIDVGVYVKAMEREAAGSLALDVGMALESALAASIPGGGRRFPVDVRVLNWAPVSFCYHVLKGRLLFSRDEAVRVRWAEGVISRYLDLKPLRHRALKEAIASWR